MNAVVTLDNHKVVGSIKNNIYKKTVTRSKHLFRKFNGYGISLCVLDELKEKGITHIQITEKDTKQIFTCSLADYFQFGNKYQFNDDVQLVLSMDHFSKQN